MHNNSTYKLVSFDIWGTLIKANPLFVEARTLLFMKSLKHDDNISMKVAKDSIDIGADKYSESTGIDMDFYTRMELLIKEIGKKPEDFSKNFLDEIRNELSELLTANLPHYIEDNILDTFKQLKDRGIKIALVSNTGFLHGDTVRKALEKMGIMEFVDYYVFSNEVGISKPHPHIFRNLVTQSGINYNEIIHIGDSIKADYQGAWKSGIHSILFDPKNRHGNRMFSINNMNSLLKIVDESSPILHFDNTSLHLLRMEEGNIVDQDNLPFDFVEYSKFKYGDGSVAKNYGHRLAKKFISNNKHLFESDARDTNIVISTSPYKTIVKGSSGIVRGFKNYLNQYLFTIGKNPVVDITILKEEMFEGDYGSFTDEQRKELMHKNDLYVMEKYIKDKILILIDDARITGSHEQNLISFFSNKMIKQAFFLYIADMEVEFAKKNPEIENTMNHGWVNNLDKLLEIMNSHEFILNARVCKYILAQENSSELYVFLARVNSNVLYNLYNGIIGDGYAKMNKYISTFKTLKSELEKRGMIQQDNLSII